jgi:hypothetical protein
MNIIIRPVIIIIIIIIIGQMIRAFGIMSMTGAYITSDWYFEYWPSSQIVKGGNMESYSIRSVSKADTGSDIAFRHLTKQNQFPKYCSL